MRAIESCFVLTAMFGVTTVGCSSAATPSESGDENVLTRAEAIQGGVVDTGDNAVVGIMMAPDAFHLGGCSGTLIAPNLVLTAHHCVAENTSTNCGPNEYAAQYPASAFRVTTSYNAMAGQHSLPAVDGSTWYGVAKVITPGNNICGQDMAILELTKPIKGICPIIPAVDVAVKKGDAYTAIGFGVTSPSGSDSGTRRKLTGPVVNCTSASTCSGMSSSSMSETLEWQGYAGASKGTCPGDSGGPALDGAGRIIGVVSRVSDGCSYDIYESVHGQADWIKKMAQQAATDGGYAVAGWVTGGLTSDVNNGYCGSGMGTPGDAGSGGADTGSADTGTGGGSMDSGTGGGGACPSGLQCIDGTGKGNYGCFDPTSSTHFPADAPPCKSDADCSSGWNCWAASAGATSGNCIEQCTPDGGGSGGGADSGTGGTGGGTDSGTGGGADSGSGSPGTGDDAGLTPGADDAGTNTGAKKPTPNGDDLPASGSCAVSDAGATSQSPSALAGMFALATFLLGRRRR